MRYNVIMKSKATLLACLVSSTTVCAIATAAEPRLPADPTGLKKYTSTYDIEPETALAYSNLHPSKTGKVRGMRLGDNDSLLFFEGQDSQSADSSKGITVDLDAYYRDRFKNTVKDYEKAIAQRKEELKQVEKDIEDFRTSYEASGGDPKTAMYAEEIGPFVKKKRELDQANFKDQASIKLINSKAASSDSGLEQKITAARKHFSELMELALSACANAGKPQGAAIECRGEPAKAMADKLEAIRIHDAALDQTIYRHLKVSELFGKRNLESGGRGYLIDNYATSLFGVKRLGCIQKSSAPTCLIVTENENEDLVENLAQIIDKNNKKLYGYEESEKLDAKQIDEEMKASKAMLKKAEEEATSAH